MPYALAGDMKADSEVLQDTLTCGSCQKDFVLSDIVKFIQHKVQLCNKENFHLAHNDLHPDHYKDPDHGGDDESKHSLQLPNRRPSISAPMYVGKNRLLQQQQQQSLSLGLPTHGGSLLAARLESKEASGALPSRTPSPASGHRTATPHRTPRDRLVDANTNTTLSEPHNQVCCTCGQSFSSSWSLLQHAQGEHGLRIYVETESARPSPSLCADQTRPSADFSTSGGQQSPDRKSSSSTSSRPSPEQQQSAGGVRQPSPCSVPPDASPSDQLLLRLPLGERQFEGPNPAPAAGTLNGPSSLFPRPSSHDFRLDASEASSRFPLRLSQASSSSPATGGATAPSSSAAFEHPFDRPRLLPLPFEPQLDFYSQRLRQLAGATSPNAGTTSTTRKLASPFGGSPSASDPSPAKKSGSDVASSPPKESPSPAAVSSTGANAAQQPPAAATSSSPASSVGSRGEGTGGPGSPNLKSCEFCGKSFRFMSNLIVHRRSHTGEKPYKCHICQHACTQSSKLKRHMKTHRTGADAKLSPGSLDNTCSLSGRSTPDCLCVNTDKEAGVGSSADRVGNGNDSDSHTNGDYDEDEEDDEEIEELSEDEDEDEVELAGDEEDEEGELAIAEDLSTPRGAASSPAAGPPSSNTVLLNDKSQDGPTVRHAHRNGSPVPSARKSLLGEVMDKIGLSDIQQYNEAYKQALQESFAAGSGGVKQEHRSVLEGALVSNGPDGGSNGKMIGQPALDFGCGLLRAFDRRSPFDSKRLKLDEGGRDLYAGMWLPSLPNRDFFLEAVDRHKSSSSSESALISVTPGCRLGGALSPRPGTSGGNFLSSCSPASSNGAAAAKGLKGDRRSDTCEYCGKVFKNCSNLTVHRRSHTGEKPYKCELCSYACAQSSKLTRHMKTHGRIGKDVYRCRFCDMPFSVPSTLEKHMRKCVVSQTPGAAAATPLAILDKDSDSKDMT